MEIAIIVVACLLAAGLIALFVTVGVKWRKTYPKLMPDGTPRPKQSAKEWFLNHLPSKRRLIQIYAALLYNANIKGFISGDIYSSKTTKYMCVPGFNCYSCPGAIGACPLGSLQNALAESNQRAPYYVLGILALFGLIFARTICGFLCPVGLGQDLLYKIRTPKLKKSRVTRIFSYLKYVFLAVLVIAIPLIYSVWNLQIPGFCKYICPAGTFGGAIMLMLNPNNAGMYANLGPLFTWKFAVLVVIMVASVFIYRFFCRFICPLGAIYGFFNRIALLGIKVDKENCTDCGLCVSHCKMDIKRVGDHECINCGECISVCPTKAIRWKGSKLFVHANTVSIDAPAEEARPLGQALQSAGAASIAKAPVETPVMPAEPLVTPERAEAEAEPITEAKAAQGAVAAAKRRKKSKRFWLELSAWIAALVVLIGALVYYNAIDVERKPKTGYEVGLTAPDFTVETYGGEQFNLYANRGKVTVVGFWSSDDESHETTLPYFNELSSKHADWNVLAVHSEGDGDAAEEYVAANCSGWTLTFAQDGAESGTYRALGGNGMFPLTVMIDAEGVVTYNMAGEFGDYEELETALLLSMNMGYEVGQTAPDFTVAWYGKEGAFNLYANRGRVTVVNFWATWCGGCKNELPYFNELSALRTEWDFVAVHGDTMGAGSAEDYIATNCSGWTLPFAQDNIVNGVCQTFASLGGKSMWPLTVIIDEEGKVVYNSTYEFKGTAELENAVLAALDKN